MNIPNINTLKHDLLANKSILITGATSGIGQTLAITCAKFGAHVILMGKNVKKLNKVYDEIMDLKLPQPTLVPFNLAGATPENYQELAVNIGQQFGRLDGLVHNAAIQGVKTEIIHYDILKWYETIQVNLNAAFLLTKYLLPLLKIPSKSSIIFTSSTQGTCGTAYQGAYGVSKAGVTNFMEVLAAECEEHTNIRINAINPHKIYSRIYTQNYPATHPDLLPSPDDIMPLYLSLLGDFSEHIHGQTINFNMN